MRYIQYFGTVLLMLLLIMGCEIENNAVELISLDAIDSSNQVITSPVCQNGDVITFTPDEEWVAEMDEEMEHETLRTSKRLLN